MRKLFLILTLSLFSIALFATDVSGQQSGVWTLANSPYNIVGNVEVPVGASLQIEPGVTVVAMGNYRLNVKGTITAVGTPADSIRFESGMADSTATWRGIRVQDATLPSTFAYIYVEKAEIGVNCNNSPVTISHSRFYKNEKGIRFYGMGNPDPPFMEAHHNLVEYSEENGILIHQQSNSHVHHNEVRYNATSNRYWGAIQLTNQSAGGSNSPEISYNHIHHNVKQGIIAWDLTGSGTSIAPYIHHNLIEHNVTGIYFLYASGYFEGNIIRNNTGPGAADDGAGVMLGGATTLPYFEDNEIYGNYCGLYIGENTIPVLGDLSSDHEWAGGGNLIYDNIDANGVPHSIYCFSYTDPTIVIKAENNYWGTNDPAVIGIGITDQLDDPALPLVDFDPWLANPPSDTSISGRVTHYDSDALENCTLMVVGVASGEIYHSFPVEFNTDFSFAIDVNESFYVVANAYLAGLDWPVWSAAGNQFEIYTYEPGIQHSLGIRFSNSQDAWHKYTVGEPIQEGGRDIYPVQHQFFVFAPDYTNWFYDEGDYRYIHAHTRHHEDGDLEFTFPENSTYAKIFNIQFGDTWQRKEIIDDAGTIRTSNISYKMLEDEMADYIFSGIFFVQVDSETGEFISLTDRGSHSAVTYFYNEDGYLYGVQSCPGAAFDFPLQTGIEVSQNCQWYDYSRPNGLCYDFDKYHDEQILDLYWIPPVNDLQHEWTHYNIYAFDDLVASTDSFTPFISISNPVHNAQYRVRASDGTNESDASPLIWVREVSTDDPIMPPTTLSVYPNPFSSGVVNIKLDDPHGQSGSFCVYNLRGQKVYTQDFAKDEGAELFWNGKDQKGQICGSGIYLLKLNLRDGRHFAKRMVKM